MRHKLAQRGEQEQDCASKPPRRTITEKNTPTGASAYIIRSIKIAIRRLHQSAHRIAPSAPPVNLCRMVSLPDGETSAAVRSAVPAGYAVEVSVKALNQWPIRVCAEGPAAEASQCLEFS